MVTSEAGTLRFAQSETDPALNPTNPSSAIVLILVAFATVYFLTKATVTTSSSGRYSTIDGLRGYLALFVFIHHSCIWHFYLKNGLWEVPPSNLFTHLGKSSVVLFFMITGFLFFGKIIDGRHKPVDWGKLFISRFLRLTPLYLASMLLLFAIVYKKSDGVLHENLGLVVNEIVAWLGFTVLGAPNINGIHDTFSIIAGVTWSLPYEWIFYFLLPLIALVVGLRPPTKYVLLSAICAFLIVALQYPAKMLVVFLAGISASILVRSDTFCRVAKNKISSCIAISCTCILIAVFQSANGIVQLLLLSVVFVIIAAGNSLFGLLLLPTSRALGELAYGIYLLHGLFLYVSFQFILGFSEAKALSPIMYWLVVVGVTPPLIVTCFFAYRYIEHPAMLSTNEFTAWIRAAVNRLAKQKWPSIK